MTENYQPRSGGGKNRYLPRRISTNIDFTPFVDMNMLLITFFMLAATLDKPQSMKLAMPTDDPTNPPAIAASKAVTLYLGKEHQVYYFQGEPDLQKSDFLLQTNYTSEGLRRMLLDKNKKTVNRIYQLTQRKNQGLISLEEYEKELLRLKENSTIVIIKPLDTSTYNDVVSALDEMLITNVGRYMIAKLTDHDKTMLNNSKVEF